MFDFLIYPAAFILALGVLVSVHEFGHFWVARKIGVKVIRFSVGFGKPLWAKKGSDGVEYVLAAIPLGGYVKMVDEREGEVSPEDLPFAFNRQSLGARSAIVAAGPLFNFLLAILLYWAIFMLGQTGVKPIVDAVKADSIAYQAGIERGMQFVSIDGVLTPTWSHVFQAFLSGADGEGQLQITLVDKNNISSSHRMYAADLMGHIEEKDFFQRLGLTLGPRLPAVLGEILPNDPADKAGLKAGDLVVRFADEPVSSWSSLVGLIQKHPNELLSIEVTRNGNRRDFEIEVGHQTREERVVGRIGAAVFVPEGYVESYQTLIQFGPLDALFEGIYKTWDMSVLTLKMLGRLVTGQLSVEKNLGSVITIAHTAGTTVSYGLTYFLGFLAGFSITLGIMNLLPIPVLDGGHLLYFLIEGITGKPVSDGVLLYAQQFGLALLFSFMVFALYIDMVRWVG